MRPDKEQEIRGEVSRRIYQEILDASQSGGGPPIAEVINETLYHEMERLRSGSSDGDSDNDKSFYRKIRHELPRSTVQSQKRYLRTIIDRYVDEICGHFNERIFKMSSKVVPLGLTALLNTLSPQRILGGMEDLPRLEDHIEINGDVDTLLALSKKGTIVLVPTHLSNLDSLLLGWTFNQIGLPPVSYGAGLNLFSNRIVGYFMRNLGAYTVDRRKTDPLYKRALKEYATVTLEYGYNNLFFPGGTRARSGAIERNLKKGLLGTSIDAFQNNLERGDENARVYVFPVNLSFPLVLEASTLVEDHLKRQGKARFIIMDDEFSRLRRWLDFIRGIASLDARIIVTFGAPIDPFGNPVNEEGESLDPKGRVIDPARYLMVEGSIQRDAARDRVYTGMLASELCRSFARGNYARSTNVVAYACFEHLFKIHKEQDLYRFLRDISSDTSFSMNSAQETIETLQGELHQLENAGLIRCTELIREGTASDILREGLRSFGTYHTHPVLQRRGVELHVGDANLLFYYRNRLDGYGLLGAPARATGKKS
jgi:glycerol-3-phosphate O-acyltransferase